MNYYYLDPSLSDPKRIKIEREKTKKLKKTNAWIQKLNQGICHYCEQKFKPQDLTMDHIVPLARGGTSTLGNLVPACKTCNQTKKLDTPVDQILDSLES